MTDLRTKDGLMSTEQWVQHHLDRSPATPDDVRQDVSTALARWAARAQGQTESQCVQQAA